MPLLTVTSMQRKILAVATVIALLIGAWFLKEYVMLILFSALVVIIFNPIYKWFIKKGSSAQKAALYTMLISALTVLIPVALVSFVTYFQVERLVTMITSGSYPHDLTKLANSAINTANGLLADAGLSYRISMSAILQSASNVAENVGKTLAGGILSSISGVFGFLTMAIIYIYVFMSMIVHQDKILDTLKKLNPLGDTASNLYFERIGAMTKATVRGQFIIAFIQGTVSAAVLAACGMQELFFFLWMLLTVLSVIPLGAGIVTIPIGVVMILTGNIWQGVVVIATHILVVTNIDNILRPRLVPKQARLDSALMILAVFAGLGMFGFFGIVLGPVLMIVIVTTVQMYLEVFADTKSIDTSTEEKPKKRFFKRNPAKS